MPGDRKVRFRSFGVSGPDRRQCNRLRMARDRDETSEVRRARASNRSGDCLNSESRAPGWMVANALNSAAPHCSTGPLPGVQGERAMATGPEMFLRRGRLGAWWPLQRHRTAGLQRSLLRGMPTRVSATWHDAENRRSRSAGAASMVSNGIVSNVGPADSGLAPSGDLRASGPQELLKRSKPEGPGRGCQGSTLLHEARRRLVRKAGFAGTFIARSSQIVCGCKLFQRRLPRAFRTGGLTCGASPTISRASGGRCPPLTFE